MATDIQELDYRVLLLQIDEALPPHHLEDLKFLSFTFTQRRHVSAVKRGLKLFDILEKENLITATDLSCLYRMLEIIGRSDLCAMIKANTVIQVDGKPDCLDQNDFKFNELLYQINKDMSREDVNSLRSLYPVSRNSEFKSGMDLFLDLYDLKLLSQTKLDTLINNLKDIGRPDLTKRLNDFKVKVLDKDQGNEEALCKGSCSQADGNSLPRYKMSSKPRVKVLDKDQGNEEALCKYKTQKSAHSSTEEKVLDSRNDISSCSQADGNSLPRYKMSSKPRGICLVINNQEFTNDEGAKKLDNRIGSDKDEENIKACFINLDFDVRVEKNVTDMEMYETYRRYALGGKLNKQHDCFVTFILSHGGTDERRPYLYGSNGHKIYLERITTLFRADSAPALAGKPKLFFLACCLGQAYSKAIPVQPTRMQQGVQTDAEEMVTVCNDQDFLIGFSTVQGNVSFRDTCKGTWYITALTQVISEYHERESLQHMIVEVNRRVAKNSHHCANEKGQKGDYAQVPAPQHTLTKQLWF